MVNEFKVFANDNDITNDRYLSTVGSLGAVFNSLRFVWSAALDKFKYKYVYGLLLIFQIVFAASISFICQNAVLYAIWDCMILFCEGGHFTLYPNIMKSIYGNERGTFLYGIAFSYTGVSAIISLFIQGMWLEYETFEYFFLSYAVLSALSLTLLLLVFSDKKYIYN